VVTDSSSIVQSEAEEAELTDLLREWDRITKRIRELGVVMPNRPGGITQEQWDAEQFGYGFGHAE
jgi:hypothetical protein